MLTKDYLSGCLLRFVTQPTLTKIQKNDVKAANTFSIYYLIF